MILVTSPPSPSPPPMTTTDIATTTTITTEQPTITCSKSSYSIEKTVQQLTPGEGWIGSTGGKKMEDEILSLTSDVVIIVSAFVAIFYFVFKKMCIADRHQDQAAEVYSVINF